MNGYTIKRWSDGGVLWSRLVFYHGKQWHVVRDPDNGRHWVSVQSTENRGQHVFGTRWAFLRRGL